MHMGTRVQKGGCIKPLCPGVKCSYTLAQRLFAVMASALSEETLPRLHEAPSCPSLSAQPTGQAWLLTGVFWHVCRKHQLQMWLEHCVLDSLPHYISTAPGDLPVRGTVLRGSIGLASLARPRHLQLRT